MLLPQVLRARTSMHTQLRCAFPTLACRYLNPNAHAASRRGLHRARPFEHSAIDWRRYRLSNSTLAPLHRTSSLPVQRCWCCHTHTLLTALEIWCVRVAPRRQQSQASGGKKARNDDNMDVLARFEEVQRRHSVARRKGAYVECAVPLRSPSSGSCGSLTLRHATSLLCHVLQHCEVEACTQRPRQQSCCRARPPIERCSHGATCAGDVPQHSRTRLPSSRRQCDICFGHSR